MKASKTKIIVSECLGLLFMERLGFFFGLTLNRKNIYRYSTVSLFYGSHYCDSGIEGNAVHVVLFKVKNSNPLKR